VKDDLDDTDETVGKGRAAGRDEPRRPARHRLGARLRAYLLAGIIVTAPISITILIVWQIVGYVDNWSAAIIPARYNPGTYLPFSIPGLGFVIMIGLLILIGWFAAGMVGRTVMRAGERILHRMPVIRSIYGTLKQIFETVLANSSRSFREVVLVEWPRRDMWVLAFVTGSAQGEIQDVVGDDAISLFMPSTPNPTTGFYMVVPRRDVVPLTMSIEDAMKLIISGGIVTPSAKARPPAGRARHAIEPELARSD
jgi:uncharacterized membrane protein